MEKLNLRLENCYGIKKLDCEFDFSNGRTFLIYAPNGVMKTSFAKTARDLHEGKEPCDQINKTLESKHDFVSDGEDFNPEQFCVIDPYNEKAFKSEDNILILLANQDQREKYSAIYKEIEAKKKNALSGLKKISGSSNFEKEIIETFAELEKKNIYEIFESTIEKIKGSENIFEFKYNDIFDSKGNVKKFLDKQSDLLDQYFELYQKLIQESGFFGSNSHATFGTAEAKNLYKSLEGGEYFSVGYELAISEGLSIVDQDQLSQTIESEIKDIVSDPDMKKIFDELDKALDGNAELKKLKKAINRDPTLLNHLRDYEGFRKIVWFSFLKEIVGGVEDLVDFYLSKKQVLEDLVRQANKNKSLWQDAVDEFENRFIDMPFRMQIKNKPDAVLRNETPTLEFLFKGSEIDRDEMVEDILSQGEKRAFYLLNIIFEIKVRRDSGQDTLFIIDDPADSFDYKNKYAIVQYLYDLSQEDQFYSIVLTHNFDLYRTLSSRLGINSENRLHAEKLEDSITLLPEKYGDTPFKKWKEELSDKHVIALIPFVRNLIEYGKNEMNHFNTLTHLLHVKSQIFYDKEGKVVRVVNGNIISGDPAVVVRAHDPSIGDFKCFRTQNITFREIQSIFEEYLGVSGFSEEILDVSILDRIFELADACDDSSLENKIVLAIAIRLKAEHFMIHKINNQNFVDNIKRSQTSALINKCNKSKQIVLSKEDREVLERVNIITPENIHLNSFMYEPLMDMGICELRGLYSSVLGLNV